MGFSPRQTVGGPGEASYRLSPEPSPLPSRAVLAQTQHPGADTKARCGQPVLFLWGPPRELQNCWAGYLGCVAVEKLQALALLCFASLETSVSGSLSSTCTPSLS